MLIYAQWLARISIRSRDWKTQAARIRRVLRWGGYIAGNAMRVPGGLSSLRASYYENNVISGTAGERATCFLLTLLAMPCDFLVRGTASST